MKQQVSIKVCGITRATDALKAAQLGADYVGFIFVRRSPRKIEPLVAAEIIDSLPKHVVPVGVFVNSPRDTVLDIISTTGIKLAQFHGYESPEYCDSFGAFPVMKAFQVKPPFDITEVDPYHTSIFLLDTYDPVRKGGTGKTFDWDLAKPIADKYRVMLAGGLKPENVVRAVEAVHPFAVDVSSGVEDSAGIKDHTKMEQFFENIITAGYHRASTAQRSI